MFESRHNSLDAAMALDQEHPCERDQFHFPKVPAGEDCLYFCGHSLGLMPKDVDAAIATELKSWQEYGVEGHFNGPYPWLPYHENITKSFANLVGAKESEVVAMNTLTVNLHLMLVSFYRPTKSRYKILIENNTFPSDKYAVDSQARFHGFDDAVVELRPDPGKKTVSAQSVLQQIEEIGEELALVLLGNCNYLSGQKFDMGTISEKAHSLGAFCGFNLAHGAGNLDCHLSESNADFAVWCSYKYLNSGPGGLAGCFVNERHHTDPKIPRFEGWWGHEKATRFEMGPQFAPIQSVEAWQLSNPPIFQLASMRASMNLFDKQGITQLRSRGDKLTSFLEFLLLENLGDDLAVVTPADRGSMLCIQLKKDPKKMVGTLSSRGVFLDFREPDILRMCPTAMYNTFEDCYKLVQVLKECL